MSRTYTARPVKIYPHTSKRQMSGGEYKHIRINVLCRTQAQFSKDVVFKGHDRQSAYENNRSPIPLLVAAHLRLLAEHNQKDQ